MKPYIAFFLIFLNQVGLSQVENAYEKQIDNTSDLLTKVELINSYVDDLIWEEKYGSKVTAYFDEVERICETIDCGEQKIWALAANYDHQLNTGTFENIDSLTMLLFEDPATQSPQLKAYLHQILGMYYLVVGHQDGKVNHFRVGADLLEHYDPDDRRLGIFYYYLAIYCVFQAHADSCVIYGLKATENFEHQKDTMKMIMTLVSFNNWYTKVGDTEASLASLLDAKELDAIFNSQETASHAILIALAMNFERLKEYDKAIATANEGLRALESEGETSDEENGTNYWNYYLLKGKVFMRNNQQKKGLEFIEQSIKVCEDYKLFPSFKTISELFLIEAHLKLKNFEHSSVLLQDFVYNLENNEAYEIYNIKIIGLVTELYKKADMKPSLYYSGVLRKVAARVIDKNEGNYNSNLVVAYNLLFLLNTLDGQSKDAIIAHDKLIEIKDSIWSQQKLEDVNRLLNKYESKKQQQVIESQKEILSERSVQVKLLFGLCLVLLLLAFSIYWYFRQRRQHIAQLEQKVKERTAALEMSNKKLANSNEELEQFAYISSHDLKEPLRNIMNFIGLLEHKIGKKEETKAYFDFIKENGTNMFHLIEDVLAFSTLRKAELAKKEIDVSYLLNQVQESMAHRLKEKNVELIIGELPVVYTDSTMLHMVFKNFIENAIKYNENASPIVEINCKSDSKFYWFTIKDNGIGIEEEYLTQIFEMFKRLHNKSKYSGTGIGLSICKRTVDYLGGEIMVESKIGHGSSFIFSIPK